MDCSASNKVSFPSRDFSHDHTRRKHNTHSPLKKKSKDEAALNAIVRKDMQARNPFRLLGQLARILQARGRWRLM